MAKNTLSPTRADDYAGWYQQVIRAADMADNSPVRGCMIIKPWGYGIWERIQAELDRRIKDTGHVNCYFPLFIPLRFLEKEAAHVEGFAKEMAVVTHHRLVMKDGKLVPDGELEEPLVVRPTSETIIGEAMANWVQSYRDLPLLLNQWANVVRWEMRPRMFLRTAEFLWQEGHTAHATQAEAEAETAKMLGVYRELAEDVLGLSIIPGEKPDGERFPGADRTYTIEAMMQDGRALQAGTSHYLGQNFAKAAGIKYQSKEGVTEFAHTTSWGMSTRTIGGVIMTHGDDIGLRLPPAIAPQQIIVVPILRDEAQTASVMEYCEKLVAAMKQIQFQGQPVRAHLDARDMQAVDKRWEWVRKGAPLVLEIGPRDVADEAMMVLRRDTDSKAPQKRTEFLGTLAETLVAIQKNLTDQAKAYTAARTVTDIKSFDDFQAYFAGDGNGFPTGKGFVRAAWAGGRAGEEKLGDLGVTIRCIPFDQNRSSDRCVLTGEKATCEAVFAKAY
jgi:prolyl-tRNA synthetase